jgi:hypothetical protein
LRQCGDLAASTEKHMTEEVKAAPQPAAAAEAANSEDSADRRAARRSRKAKPVSKSDAVVALLGRARGATIDEMMKVTGWQSHSVRGFIAGTVKKKLGHPISSEKADRGRVYRIAAEAQ